MPQFCLLFYAILQSWRPKGGALAQCPPSKYTPALKRITDGSLVNNFYNFSAKKIRILTLFGRWITIYTFLKPFQSKKMAKTR